MNMMQDKKWLKNKGFNAIYVYLYLFYVILNLYLVIQVQIGPWIPGRNFVEEN